MPSDKNIGTVPAVRGIYLSVEDIERLTKAFQNGIKAKRDGQVEPLGGSCGIAICGNGAAI